MVEAVHVRKSYGKRLILSDVSFCAKPGEQIAIAGKNGCGKTTLLKIMAGIEKADSGQISFYGKPVGKSGKEAGRSCGYVPQENPLLEELSVRDNLRLWGGKKSLLDAGLREMFALDDIMKVPVGRLSGGMKRRVAIACAVAGRPPVVLMDEPTAAVDVYYKSIIRQWMREYTQKNGILILSTHDEQEIADSSRCFLLQEGRIRELQKEECSLSGIFNGIKE